MNWRKHTDYRVYLVTDRELCLGRSLEDVVLAAVRGGTGAVQLREKQASGREFLALARALVAALQPRGIPLIINDRADIALASGAAGLHVGQSDLPPEDARRLMGPDAIVGLSVETREELLAAESLDIDYVGVSPIFATPTKTDTHEPWGLDGLRWAREHSPLTLVAIGGIHKDNAAEVVAAGAHSLAVVSELCSAPDPEKAARNLLSVFEN
ncbi:thiamine phosphate synthase [uncultured Mailhella sp.]|uniref:thiamine phosphate synthase n=1 Tax=uncultured Mailhella sp. TaxID=1981031 RepID=UPI0025D47E80|nr:thiamine phosphate synthase [uncultured Mailhella sp.]